MEKFHRPGVVVALVMALAACVPEAPVPPPDMTENCGAPALQYLLGQPAAVLKTMTFPPQTRIVAPGMAVTMDYSPNRLNIETDAANRISRISCG